MKRDQSLRTLALVVFFLSGISGLIYQVVWTKLLTTTMGNSMLSITTVVTTFMAGLALGSLVAGRVVDRIRAPFLVFGFLELGIGLCCFVLPTVIKMTEPALASIYQSTGSEFLGFRVVQFLLCGAILIVPTTLMGATLPVLSRHVASRIDRVGWSVGRLYSINTFGAVVGAFATGFLLIPQLGVTLTTGIGISINFGIALVVVVSWFATGDKKSVVAKAPSGSSGEELAGDGRGRESESAESMAPPRPAALPLGGFGRLSVYGAFFFSGFAAMGYQIGWTRVLSLVFGPSVYNFSLTVATFILGLALGALLAAAVVDRVKDLLLLLAGSQFLVGLSGLFVVTMFGRLPIDLLDLYLSADQMTFGVFQFSKFIRAFVLMLVPTILMGAVFPIAARVLAQDLRYVGRAVGNAYAVNTVGSILGSFLTGFVFIPWLGIRGSLLLAVLVNLGVGLVLVFASVVRNGVKLRTIPAAILVPGFALFFFVPAWDSEILGSGVYLYAQRHREVLSEDPSMVREVMLGDSKLLYHEEGITATVSVRQVNDLVYMKTSGKTDASSAEDMFAQVLSAHIPLSIHPDPKTVCVVGLGSGVTLGSAGIYGIEEADCIEISAEVVKGAHFFNHVNQGALTQPDRLHVIVEDGRNFLKMCGKTYDAIISEPSNPWIAGVGSLFTQEYFQACRDALNPGGIVAQWANTYNMGADDFRSVLRTFQEVFPNCMLWECVLGTDYLLVGVPDDFTGIDYQRVSSIFDDEAISSDLSRIGVKSVTSLLKHFVFAADDMRKFSEGASIHTDDHTFLEYTLPRNLYLSTAAKDQHYEKFLSVLQKSRRTAMDVLRVGHLSADEKKELASTLVDLQRSRNLATEGWIELCSRRGFAQALASFREALEIDPGDGDTRTHLSQLLRELAKRSVGSEEELPQALMLFKESLAIKSSPEVERYANQVGLAVAQRLLLADELDLAFTEYMDLWKRDPKSRDALLGLAEIHERRGNLREAIRIIRLGLGAYPRDAAFFNRSASIRFEMQDFEGAANDWEVAVSQDADNVRYRNNLATVFRLLGRTDEAMVQYQRIQALDPDYPQAYLGLGQVLMQSGDFNGASAAFTKALTLKPDLDGLGPVLYTLVATDARRGDLDRAFHWLSELMRLDLADPSLVREDPAMDPLKEDPRFESTLASVVSPGVADPEAGGSSSNPEGTLGGVNEG